MLIELVLPTLKYTTRKHLILEKEWFNVTDIKLTLRKPQKFKYSSKENVITSSDFLGMSSLSDMFWI